jgi:hypothetical protein
MLDPVLDMCRLIFGIASDLLRSQVALKAETVLLSRKSMCCDAHHAPPQWAHGLVSHGNAPVLREGCEPLIGRHAFASGPEILRNPTPTIIIASECIDP